LSISAELRLGEFGAQSLTNIAWAYAMAGQIHEALFVALAMAAKLRLSEFNAQELANTA